MKFLRSPLEFIEDLRNVGSVGSVLFSVNRLDQDGKVAVATGKTEIIPTNLVLKSVGYSSSCPDDAIPFDGRRGVIVNEAGRVTGMPGNDNNNINNDILTIFDVTFTMTLTTSPTFKVSTAADG